jgi:hypothetical protein
MASAKSLRMLHRPGTAQTAPAGPQTQRDDDQETRMNFYREVYAGRAIDPHQRAVRARFATGDVEPTTGQKPAQRMVPDVVLDRWPVIDLYGRYSLDPQVLQAAMRRRR